MQINEYYFEGIKICVKKKFQRNFYNWRNEEKNANLSFINVKGLLNQFNNPPASKGSNLKEINMKHIT